MKSNFKRLISLALSICLIVTVFTCVGATSLTASAANSNMMRLNNKAWQWVYQEFSYSKFQSGASYQFKIDYIQKDIGSTAGDRVRLIPAQSNGDWGSAISLVRISGSNTYSATFTYNGPNSGSGLQIQFITRDTEDDLFFGNPELYKLDANGDPTGDNLVLDPAFATGLSSNTWGSTANPWFSNGSATSVSFPSQPSNYFNYDPEVPNMMIMHDQAWVYMQNEVASNKFQYGARYRFTMDIIPVRTGSTEGDRFRAKPVDSSGNYINSVPTRIPGTNTYQLEFTHQYNSTSGTSFQLWLITRDIDDIYIYGNPKLYKLDGSGNATGKNLIGDSGFYTGISPNTWASGVNPWYSNGSAKSNNVSFIPQPANYFNMETVQNSDPLGTAPEAKMLRVESQGWESLVTEPYLVPGKSYRISYNRKYFGTVARPGTLSMQYRNSGGLTGFPAANRTDGEDGYTTTVDITMPNDAISTGTNLKMMFYFGEQKGNIVYIANLDIREIDGNGDPVGNNLLVNGGFYGSAGSVGSSDALWNYELGGTWGTASVVSIPDNFFSDEDLEKKVLKVSGGDWSKLRKDVFLEASTKYQLSYNYKYDSSAPLISMQSVDTSNNFASLPYTTSEDPNEYKKYHTFTMPANAATSRENYVLRFQLAHNAHDAVAYWYDIELYELDGDDEPTGINLLDNGDFALDNAGQVTSLVGYDIQSNEQFDRMDLISLPANDFFTYYTPATRITYLINNILGKSQTAKSITLDVNADSSVNILDLVALKKSIALLGNEGEMDQKAEVKKAQINNAANTASNYTITGTTYYISKSQTLANVPSNLKSGDAVLFERGGTYRLQNYGGSFNLTAGVTYGAYGTGAKPIISGSVFDYKNRTWTETSSGSHIWKTSVKTTTSTNVRPTDVVGNIYFNNASSSGVRKSATNQLNAVGQYYNYNGTAYQGGDGYVYLYCTSNPSTYYSNIEISQNRTILTLANNVTIDNLDIRYGGNHGIAGAANNVTITNCNIGWIGGAYNDDEARFGNGIQISQHGDNILVENNYIYECYDAGFTFQSYSVGTNGDFTNITFRDNLVEKCQYSIEFFTLSDENTGNGTDNVNHIDFSHNILRLAGYGWSWTERSDNFEVAHIRVGQKRYWSGTTDFKIQNNAFDCSKGCLVFWRQGDSVAQPGMSISGNAFYQKYYSADGRAMDYGLNNSGSGSAVYATTQGGLEEAVATFDSNPGAVKWLAYLR